MPCDQDRTSRLSLPPIQGEGRGGYIDATFASARGGGEEIGNSRRGKGVKILAIVDRQGLPLSVSPHAANHHEVTLVQLSFEFYMIEVKPHNLIGDKAYDSNVLDEQLRNDGVEMTHHIDPTANSKHTMGVACDAMRADGSSRDILPGCNGNAVCWFAGSTTPRISSVLYSSPRF